ncbi:hypothetical protein CYLTODRAFT_424018 [Cylindrobasidium torrendii FP15055 ss-10]|uniref:PCI domain-containing protein n=1 Tax=Cylindrobasidium torrendii FP15055 ss-10 TaxID=1314674 RepID=A0A0D7B5Q5_9AGAR|nr:hypothetical protein CYLTODRAFT_424018 [Cylindrobasidium torrendii FP15055 ss-10]
MEVGTNFAAKLEPYILMSKSVKGAAAAKLAQDATSAQGVFVFSELLDLPNIQELGSGDHAKALSLLQLFAYKTYRDYVAHKDQLPTLNAAQITKLKHLTIVSLATEKRILPYSELLVALDMTNVRELEDLIIDAIYLDMLRGRLDQKESQLEVEYTMGRDLEPGKLEATLAALRHWTATTSSVLETLDNKIIQVSRRAEHHKLAKDRQDKHVQDTLAEIAKEKDEKSGKGGNSLMSGSFMNTRSTRSMDKDRMDVDYDPSMEGKGKNRKPPQDSKPSRKRNRM